MGTGGSWSELVSQEIFPHSGCSNRSPVAQPVTQPVSQPVKQPVSPPVSQPVKQPVSPPTKGPSSGEELSCPSGYTGLYPSPDCVGYFHCSEGAVISAEIKCPPDLLFNYVPQYCDWDYNVNCTE